MGSTTIHTLAYKIVGDGKQFKSEMSRVNAELRAAKKVVDEYTPAVTKHKNEIAALRDLESKGHFKGNMEAYNKALRAQKKALFDASVAGKAYRTTLNAVKGIAVAGAAAATVVIKSAYDQFAALEKLHKSAERMGADFVQLQQIVKAGQLEDVDEAAMTSALEHFNKLIGAAELGNTKALKTLEALKISAAELKTMSLEDKLTAVADALSKIPDEEARLVLLQKTLGETGVSLESMLGRGSAALKDQIDKAKALGGVISETDYGKIAKVNDEMDKFAVTWNGILRQLAIALAPTLEKIVDILNRLMPKENESINPLYDLDNAQQKAHAKVEQMNVRNLEREYLRLKRHAMVDPNASLTEAERARMAALTKGDIYDQNAWKYDLRIMQREFLKGFKEALRDERQADEFGIYSGGGGGGLM